MNILVTAIGSFSADCVINTLRSHRHFVVGCDIYPSEWHTVSKDCNVVYQVPFATKEKEYINSLLHICTKHKVKYVFPLTDLEIDVLNKYRQEFKDNGVLLCIQSVACLEVARDKYKMYRLFKDDPTVKVPLSVFSCNLAEDFPLPAIAKPVNGRSSEGLQRIHHREDLLRMKEVDGYIIQELLDGNVYTIDYVRNASTKSDFAIPREELLRTKNGAGTTVRIVPNEYLMNVSSYIGNKLDLNGCVNMEFIHHENAYYLIDINPRFSAGVAFSNFVGYDMVTSHLNCFADNEDIISPIDYKEQLLCKRYKEESL
ncbi:ATP-grasp domain-containing protein [uncultured Bacteroides sp.]|uniref:ATP-grasp domain-containing protein n=1 Tax=uncultured Bacteroides sp. TaxID=162156 RepID=UPI00262F676E|nr:ATP-grasp domain-containing protein [uncultured Bacteroides sp.]